jgi:SprT protein
MTDAQSKALENIKFYVEMGNEMFVCNMPEPKLSFKLRGQNGGMYYSSKHTIKLNNTLLHENLEEYIEQVIPHEIAHAFQRYLYGHTDHYNGRRIMPHGKEWKQIMRDFGKSPDRCHSMETTNARVVRDGYHYRCRCQTFNLTIIRHRKIQKGKNYKCKGCKGTLEYIGSAA